MKLLTEDKLLDGCFSYAGPLLESDRKVIMDYINEPSQERWIIIAGIVINPNQGLGLSIKDAVMICLVDEHAAGNQASAFQLLQLSEGELPCSLLVARAIKKYKGLKADGKKAKKK